MVLDQPLKKLHRLAVANFQEYLSIGILPTGPVTLMLTGEAEGERQNCLNAGFSVSQVCDVILEAEMEARRSMVRQPDPIRPAETGSKLCPEAASVLSRGEALIRELKLLPKRDRKIVAGILWRFLTSLQED